MSQCYIKICNKCLPDEGIDIRSLLRVHAFVLMVSNSLGVHAAIGQYYIHPTCTDLYVKEEEKGK